MTDATTTGADTSGAAGADDCGCCRPANRTIDEVVSDLVARRDAVDARLRRLEPAGASR